MNVLSLFDGMSCGRIALGRADVQVNQYFSSEIKDTGIRVANHNYPQDAKCRLGDVCKIKGEGLPKIDLLIGGSPCQDFSRQNSVRAGLDGAKSGLFFEWFRLYNELQPKHFLLENVIMDKFSQYEISKYLKCDPIRINSSDVSAQLRDRLYWTNIPQTNIVKKDIQLSDILESGYTDRIKSRCLLASFSELNLLQPVKRFHRYQKFGNLVFNSKSDWANMYNHYMFNFKKYSAKQINYSGNVYDNARVLSQLELERLQTVPEGYTSILTHMEAANLLGDGWTVDVISHLLSNIHSSELSNKLF